MARRTAAITGATPETLFWTIQHACPLRPPVARELAERTFQQLRGLREWDAAIRQGRVVGEWALHPTALKVPLSEVKGFSGRELHQNFGGAAHSQSCRNCPVNSLASAPEFLASTDDSSNWSLSETETRWAGCFGIWPLWPLELPPHAPSVSADSDDASSQESRSPASIIPWPELPVPFTTQPRWYQYWTQSPLDATWLLPLADALETGLRHPAFMSEQSAATAAGFFWESPRRNLQELVGGLRRAHEQCAEFHVRWQPAGVSDGSVWRVPPQCGRCQAARGPRERPCSVCGDVGNWQAPRERRVLGIRPYLRLCEVLGEPATAALVERACELDFFKRSTTAEPGSDRRRSDRQH